MNFDLKMVEEMNLRIITKNDAADPEIGFLTKSIPKPHGRSAAMPTALDLRMITNLQNKKIGSFRKQIC